MKMIVRFTVAIGVLYLAGCASQPQKVVIEHKETIEHKEELVITQGPPPKEKIPVPTPACAFYLKQFRENGVVLTNLNTILERGLTREDFIGDANNEAFEVLASARREKCVYHPSYLK